MVSFNADITDPPKISSSDAKGTVMGWVGYVVVAGMMFVALGIAQNVIAPTLGNLFASLGLGSGQETTTPGFAFGGDS